MDTSLQFKYAGFWNRLLALIVDWIAISIFVFPIAFLIGKASPNTFLVEVPFNLFTTTSTIEVSPKSIEKHFDGSSHIIQEEIQEDRVLGVGSYIYKVATTESNGETRVDRTLVDAKTRLPIQLTSSGDIELIAIFIYWILLEISTLQGSLGKRVMGLIVINRDGSKPTLMDSFSRNILKILSGMTLGIGFMMAGWTANKQSLHDKISRSFVIKKSSNTQNPQNSLPEEEDHSAATAVVFKNSRRN